MALSLSFNSQDHISNHESVSISRPGYASFSVTKAVRHPISTRELSRSNGVYLASDVVWTLDGTEVGATAIQPKWVIIDSSSNRYIVLDAAYSDIGKFHRVTARNFVIVNGLHDLVDVYRNRRSDDLAGRKVQTAELLYSSLPCRVQQVDRTSEEVLGVQKLGMRYEVYLESDPGIKIKDQIRVVAKNEDGAVDTNFARMILEVEGVDNPKELTDLPVLYCIDNGARF